MRIGFQITKLPNYSMSGSTYYIRAKPALSGGDLNRTIQRARIEPNGRRRNKCFGEVFRNRNVLQSIHQPLPTSTEFFGRNLLNAALAPPWATPCGACC